MKNSIIILMLCLTIGISGCDKWLTVQPKTVVASDEMFQTSKGFQDALIGSYQLMQVLYSHYGYMISGTIEHMACSWETTNGSIEEKLGLHEYNDDIVDNEMEKIFKAMYKAIANVSELIKALESQDGVLNDAQYAQYMGEASGLRAFLHLELMRLWGPMPSNIRAEKKYLPFVEGIQLKRYEYLDFNNYMSKVQNDLIIAEQLLKKNPMNIYVPKKEFINYYAILAMQARFHFWVGNNDEAIDYGNRLLEADTLKQFPLDKGIIGGDGSNAQQGIQTAFIHESIWRYAIMSEENTSIRFYNFESFVKEEIFEGSGSDRRLDQWDEERILAGEDEPRMKLTKFNLYIDIDAKAGTTVSGYIPLIRISEIYLMMMELGSMDRANELYAEYANARRINPVVFNNKAELLKQLKLEYRKEFIGEGQMFFAYKRWGTRNIPRSHRGNGESAYVPPIPKKEFNITN